jgi:hypothetical protein
MNALVPKSPQRLRMMKFKCAHCGVEADRFVGEVNRSRRSGLPLYCGRECAGLERRKWESPAQRKAEKQAYDAARRIALADELRAKKAEYHKRTYDPAKAAVERKKRMPKHIEYCQSQKYREWKREYDRQYLAKKDYGEFWECHLLALDIREEVLRQSSDYDIRLEKGGIAKTQQRRRDYEQFRRSDTDGQELEVGPLGNLAGRQERRYAARPS